MGSDASIHAPVAARPGYNGQLHERTSGWQALGNGHRIYNPVLMRFHTPDALSPFDKGGINAYAYCGDDPVNRADPSGRFHFKLMSLGLVFTGLTGALVAARSLVHPEDKRALTLLTIATLVTSLSAATVGAAYIYKKRHSKRPLAPVAEEPATPAAPALSLPGTPRQVTFADPAPVTLPSSGSTLRERRMSAPAAGGSVGQGPGRRDVPAQMPLQTPASVAPGTRSGRRISVVTTGPGRKPMKGADKPAKRIRSTSIRRQSMNSSYTAF